VIAALLALLAVLAVAPDHLTVASPRGQRDVAVVTERGFPALAAAQLAQVLSLDTQPTAGGDGVAVEVLGQQYDFLYGAAYFRVGARVYPLAGGAYRARDSLFVPYQWAVDYLPRLEPRLRFDADRARLEELPAPPPMIVVRGAPRHHVVAIDPGHGGVDVGMMGPIGVKPFLREKDVTLAIARALKAELERRGIGTVMTRDKDTLIALGDRGRIAAERGAELFVSIHVNAANPRWHDGAAYRGFETYYLAEARTEDARRVERMENASVRFETDATAARGDPLRFILRDLAQNEHLRESSRMATLVQEAIGRVRPGESRGVKQAGFMVLATSYMPAVLVEVGYGTNPEEARMLVSDAGQRLLARAIADGIERYLAEYDRRMGATQ